MRDPYAPIPTSARWWARAPMRTPPPPGPPRPDRGRLDPATFDPLSLLDRSGDRLGIDRRRRARGVDGPPRPHDKMEMDEKDDLAKMLDVVSTGHVRVRQVIGLRAGGTAPSLVHPALVQVVSWCPQGVLARAVDPTDRQASSRGRAAAHRAFRTLVPELARGASSPLFAASLAVLSARVVRDLAEASRRRLEVSLVVPRGPKLAGPSRYGHEGPALRIRGELAPLTDPQPELLAIALAASDAARLHELWLA